MKRKESKRALSILGAAVAMGFALAPVAQGAIIGQWLLNGDLNDSSGNGNHGVFEGAEGSGSFVATPGGQGVYLNGVNNSDGGKVNFGSPELFDRSGDKATSIAAWIKLAAGEQSGRIHNIFGWEITSSFGLMYERPPGDVAWLHRHGVGYHGTGGGSTPVIESTCTPNCDGEVSDVQPDQWHHLVAVKDRPGQDAVGLFLDGQLVNYSGGRAPIVDVIADQDLSFGDGSGNRLEGTWDQVTLWDEYLSASQVADLYAAGPVIPEPTSIALIGMGLLAFCGLRRR